jgi:uncharacterized protein YecE (DUF72 family)
MVGHLLQLPPKFTFEDHYHILETFLNYWNTWRESEGKNLCNGYITVNSWGLIVEFRNISWMKEITFELLRRYNVTYCAVIEPLLPPRMDLTRKDLLYVRFHGYGQNTWFNYLFNDEEMSKWANELESVVKKNPQTKIVAYFNNHFSGNAVKNALDLMPKLNITPESPLEQVIQEFKLTYQTNRKIPLKKTTKKNKSPFTLDKYLP